MAENGEAGNKRQKSAEEKEDRISELPESVIQLILSSLPSVKDAIRCSILSKRWRQQWSRLPAVNLDPTGMSEVEFFKFTDHVLNSFENVKIEKFRLSYLRTFSQDPHFVSKILFATTRNVEDMKLDCYCRGEKYVFPDLLFSYTSLKRLRATNMIITPTALNWANLKILLLRGCSFTNQSIQTILSGSPILEVLGLSYCDWFQLTAIASKSLKKVLVVSRGRFCPDFSCPNLEELTIMGDGVGCVSVSDEFIKSVISVCPLLKFVKLHRCEGLDRLVIASDSLRTLILQSLKVPSIEIVSPNLEHLELMDVSCEALKLKNLSSSKSCPLEKFDSRLHPPPSS